MIELDINGNSITLSETLNNEKWAKHVFLIALKHQLPTSKREDWVDVDVSITNIGQNKETGEYYEEIPMPGPCIDDIETEDQIDKKIEETGHWVPGSQFNYNDKSYEILKVISREPLLVECLEFELLASSNMPDGFASSQGKIYRFKLNENNELVMEKNDGTEY